MPSSKREGDVPSPSVSLPGYNEFKDIFCYENAAIDYLRDNGVLFIEGMICPNCSEGTLGKCGDIRKVRCGRRTCKKKISCFKGSFFQCTNLPPHLLLNICWELLGGMKNVDIRTKHGLSSATTAAWWKNFRELLAEDAIDDTVDRKVGGLGIVIDIDIMKLSRRSGDLRSGDSAGAPGGGGVWVIGGMEKASRGKVFVRELKDNSPQAILHLINKSVLPGSVVVAHCWKGFRPRDLEDIGCERPITNYETNTIDGSVDNISISVPTRHHTVAFEDGPLILQCWKRRFGVQAWDRFMQALRQIRYNKKTADQLELVPRALASSAEESLVKPDTVETADAVATITSAAEAAAEAILQVREGSKRRRRNRGGDDISVGL